MYEYGLIEGSSQIELCDLKFVGHLHETPLVDVIYRLVYIVMLGQKNDVT